MGEAAAGGGCGPGQAAHLHEQGRALPGRGGPVRAQDGRQALRAASVHDVSV